MSDRSLVHQSDFATISISQSCSRCPRFSSLLLSAVILVQNHRGCQCSHYLSQFLVVASWCKSLQPKRWCVLLHSFSARSWICYSRTLRCRQHSDRHLQSLANSIKAIHEHLQSPGIVTSASLLTARPRVVACHCIQQHFTFTTLWPQLSQSLKYWWCSNILSCVQHHLSNEESLTVNSNSGPAFLPSLTRDEDNYPNFFNSTRILFT